MGAKTKGFLIAIIVISILLGGFGMYLETSCVMPVKDEKWKQQQQEVCEISYETIDRIMSIINSRR